MSSDSPPGRQRLSRRDRRTQLLRAAARAFLDGGFAGTSLDDVAAAAGVTRAIIYRHFESKRGLYLAVLLDTREHIRDHIGDPEQFAAHTVRDLASAAREVPDGFRLLYRHARREPDFAEHVEELSSNATQLAQSRLGDLVANPGRRRWVAALMPALIIEGILAWLETDQPFDTDELARVLQATNQALTTPTPVACGESVDTTVAARAGGPKS